MPVAASIVYDGVAGGGDLFEGIKFFLLQRIPQRQRFLSLVEQNGGEISKLEQNADIVIADHAKKHLAPPGSISWTFIEKSVKNGVLEDLEDYPAGESANTVREVGSRVPGKQTRTHFTPEDDRLLMKWVVKAELRGEAIKGNEIFKRLELQNNRHTFQSWRDRWIKVLSLKPRPNLDDDSQEPEPAPRGAAPKSIASRRVAPRQTQAPTTQKSLVESKLSRSSIATGSRIANRKETVDDRTSSAMKDPQSKENPIIKAARNAKFTRKETKLLEDHYDDIINVDKDKAYDAWAAWHYEYPSHTPSEWANYFQTVVEPQIREQRNRQMKVVNRANKTHGKKHPSKLETAIDPTPAVLEPRYPELSNEEDFVQSTDYLVSLLREDTANLQMPNLKPLVCGKRIKLYELWQIVTSVQLGGYDVVDGCERWSTVAVRLGFNDDQLPAAASKLKLVYREILPDLENELSRYQDNMDDLDLPPEVPVGDWSEGLFVKEADAQEDDYDDDLDAPLSSPPKAVLSSSSKRSLLESTDPTEAESTSKRRRIKNGKGKEREIPSTPDSIIQGARKQDVHSTLKPSPTILDSPILGQPEPKPRTEPIHYPDLSSALPHHTLEPETQDFHFMPLDNDEPEMSDTVPASPTPVRKKAPHPKENPVSEPPNKRPMTDLDEWLELQQSLGYEDHVLIEALEATCYVTRDAGVVMESIKRGEGIPRDMPGVWTEKDDKALNESTGKKEFARVLQKHGGPLVEKRKDILKKLSNMDELKDEELLRLQLGL